MRWGEKEGVCEEDRMAVGGSCPAGGGGRGSMEKMNVSTKRKTKKNIPLGKAGGKACLLKSFIQPSDAGRDPDTPENSSQCREGLGDRTL